MAKLFDTMKYIEFYEKPYYRKGYFHELLIFDILKNRDEESRKRQFKNLSYYMVMSNSNLLFREGAEIKDLFKNRDFESRYSDALKIAKWHANNLYLLFFDFCIFIVEITLIEKARPILTDKDKSKFEEIMAKIVLFYNDMKTHNKELEQQCTEAIFQSKSEKIESDLFINLINIIIDKVNLYLGIDYLRLNKIKGFNTNEIAVNNRVKFTKECINEFFDKIVSFRNYSSETKTIYKEYMNNLLIKSGKLQFNDMADINLIFSARKNKMELITKDGKASKIYRYIELLK